MSIFGKDRQFMSDLELEEAGASLLNDSSSRRNNAPVQQNQNKQSLNRNTQPSNNTSTAGQAPFQRKPSQDSINNRVFNDVFNQLGEAYTSKKYPDMRGEPDRGSRYGGVPASTSNDPRPSYAPDEDLIDFEPAPSRGPPPASNRRVYSPVNSDHPSDLTEGTWDSRAGLIGVVPSRQGTMPNNRPSGAPMIATQSARPAIEREIPRGDRDKDRERDVPNNIPINQNNPERSNGYPVNYHRSYSTTERQPTLKATTPLATDDFEVYNGPPGGYGVGGDTLRGAIEDDRRSHFSMATSVVSTIPLSTQPAATKTMSGLYALLLIMLGVAVTAGDVISRRNYPAKYADFYAMYVFGAGTLCALYMCLACVYGKQRGSAPIDHHNGSVYIRIGAVVFCLGSLAHSAIVLAETFQYQDNCYIYARLGSISLRALFQVTQLFVVVIHSKVCIQSWNGLARLVLAHIIAANFFMWFKLTLKETEESIVVNVPRHYHNIRMFCDRNYANSFTDMEEESTPILVPMAVAYCIIAGTMLFTMWRNIGKDYSIEHREESCEEHEKQLTFECKEGVIGVMAGAFAVMASISVLVLWIMFSNDRSLYDYLVSIYQAYNAAWLILLIFLFPLATAALKRHKKQDHYHNSLNRPILIVCTTGTFAYCILNIMSAAVLLLSKFSWVAVATLCGYSVHAVETAFQTVYLLDGLRRCPRKKRKPPSKSFVVFFLLVNVSMWITIIFELKETALNPLQEDFYGIINWQVLIHFVGPIASLYRFHSVCCFLDVWKFAY